MSSLNTVKEIGLLVFGFKGIKGGIRDIVLLASHADLECHVEIEEDIENENDDGVTVLFREQFYERCCHFRVGNEKAALQ